PAPPPHDARRARRLRRGLLPLRRGDRPLLPRREGGLGTLVRAVGDRRARAPGGDRPEVLHAEDALALARDRALRAEASRAAARSLALPLETECDLRRQLALVELRRLEGAVRR